MARSLVPEVPDEEVLGPAGRSAGAPSWGRGAGGWGRWVPWIVVGLIVLSVAWGLLVITP